MYSHLSIPLQHPQCYYKVWAHHSCLNLFPEIWVRTFVFRQETKVLILTSTTPVLTQRNSFASCGVVSILLKWMRSEIDKNSLNWHVCFSHVSLPLGAIRLCLRVLLTHCLSFPLQQFGHRRYSKNTLLWLYIYFSPSLSFFNRTTRFLFLHWLFQYEKMKIKKLAEWIFQPSLLITPIKDCSEPPSLKC